MMGAKPLILVALLALLVGAAAPILAKTEAPPRKANSRWGADYFPNVALVTHEGKTVRFFDDLVKDKVVVINFIFTRCRNSCPLETARLAKVRDVLGDRVGSDVFMYSISIDPEHDTPEVLADYAEKFKTGPGWLFLTGDETDITLLRQKLGLFIDEIQDSPNNDHNLSLIIGNQATGRWMKRSPFENPQYLATQIGSWLHNWKLPNPEPTDYAHAPKLRNLSMGENLFRTRCSACHTIGKGDVVGLDAELGPDLLGVVDKREPGWLARWIAKPDEMLERKDPLAMQLFAKYNEVPMPNMQLNELEVAALIEFMDVESRRVEQTGVAFHETENRR